MRPLDAWPEFMAALKEFRVLDAAQWPELVSAADEVRAAPQDFFVQTLSEKGAERWERMLDLPIQKGTDPGNRRYRIMTWITAQAPYTVTRLRELLDTLCGAEGYTLAADAVVYTMTVRVALTAKQNYDDVEALLGRVAPANLIVDLSLLYNQHQTLGGYTHSELAAYTHEQLRNEVISHGE